MNHAQSHGASFDQAFLSEMVGHHQSAIEMAQIAVERAEHPELKQLAQNIVQAQQAEQAQMQNWLKQWYGDSAGEMGGMQMGGMDSESKNLRTARPFDQAFIDAMIPHHQSAIREAQGALAQAEHDDVRELARNIIARQQPEIAEMQAWRDEWYGAVNVLNR